MNRSLRTAWQRARRRLGWPGLGGAALLIVSGVVGAAWRGFAEDSDRLSRGVASRPVEAQEKLALLVPSRATESQRLADLTAGLPTFAQNAADLQKLFELAHVHGLALNKADYQLASDPRAPLATYSVSLPVREGYAKLKQFNADVLRALPHAALDELRLERGEAGNVELDARIRYTLIYRGI